MTKNNNLKLALILGFLSAFAPLSIDMYLSSMPTLERYFAVSADTIQLTLASFFIGFSLGQAFYGPISDKYGRKPPLYIGLLIFVIASVGCALSTTVEWLIFFRFLEALGACAGGVISRAVVRDLYHPSEASKIYSYLMLVSSVAPMLSPIAGGYILISLGWKAIFLILAALGVISLFSIVFWLEESHAKNRTESIAIKNVANEYAKLLKHKYFMGYALSGGFAMAGMFAYITSSPFVFIDTFHLSVENYGILFGANAVVFVLSAQINARIVNKIDSSVIFDTAMAMLALSGIAMFAATLFEIGGIYGIILPLLCFMSSIGFIVPNATALAMAPFAANAGSASALLGTMQFSMAAGSSILLGALQKAALISMGSMIMFCGVAALAVYIFVVKTQAAIEINT